MFLPFFIHHIDFVMRNIIVLICACLVSLPACTDIRSDIIIDPLDYSWTYISEESPDETNGLRFYMEFKPANPSYNQAFLCYGFGEVDLLPKKGRSERVDMLYSVSSEQLSLFVKDTLFMTGKILENNRLEVSWTGSLGDLWDTCHKKYDWPSHVSLKIGYDSPLKWR